MKSTLLVIALFLGVLQPSKGQKNYSDSPPSTQFVTEDVERFWQAFDKIDSLGKNTFKEYVKKGTPGVKGFMWGRIGSAYALYSFVNS